jgi:hypothetical protein
MIVIPSSIDTIFGDVEITKIATTMFNMEIGYNVFDMDGSIGDCSDYHMMTSGGISFKINSIINNLLFLFTPETPFTINDYNKFIEIVKAKIEYLDTVYQIYQENLPIIKVYSESSSNFTVSYHVKEISSYTSSGVIGRSYARDTTRRSFISNEGSNGNNYNKIGNCDNVWINQSYTQGNDKYLFKCGNLAKYCEKSVRNNRRIIDTQYESTMMFRTLIIDLSQILIYSDGVNVLNRCVKIKDFHIYSKIYSRSKITLSVNDNIDINYTILDMVYRKMGIDTYINDRDARNSVFKNVQIFNTIYSDTWENIKPIRLDNYMKFTGTTTRVDLGKLLHAKLDYYADELKELKSISVGEPSKQNDACCNCRIKLFDEIYALETPYIHILLCRYCITTSYITEHLSNPDIFSVDCRIIKVLYPRTFKEVIFNDTLNDLSTEMRNLLCMFIEKVPVVKSRRNKFEVSFDNKFVGVSDISALLMRERTENVGETENTKFFVISR